MNIKQYIKKITIGERIVLATVMIFLCFLHDTGLRLFDKTGFVFDLYGAEKFSWTMGFLIIGCFVGLHLFLPRKKTRGPVIATDTALKIEADMKGRCNLQTHLHCKKN